MANWYIIYTRPSCEKKVAEYLSKRRIEYYCPITKDYDQWNDLNKNVFTPLFPCYIFIRCNADEFYFAKNHDGVINFVYWLGKLAVVRDIEIEMIKRFLNEHSSVYLEKSEVSTTDIVRIINGPLMEEEANGMAVSANKVKLVLPSLGYCIIADEIKENIHILLAREPERRLSGI